MQQQQQNQERKGNGSEQHKKQEVLVAQEEPEDKGEKKDAEYEYMKLIEDADKESGKYLFKRMTKGSKNEGFRNW